MKNNCIKSILTILFAIASLSASAQIDLDSKFNFRKDSQSTDETTYSLTPDKETDMKTRAKQMVKQLTTYIEDMGSKENSLRVRQRYSDIALGLFIADGDAYEENGVQKKGVYMEITSVNRKKVTKTLMKDYFKNLINLNYTNVTIISSDIADIQVSNLQKIDDNTYVCTCYFVQYFCGTNEIRTYKDITKKRVKCYIKEIETTDEPIYMVLLGDVSADETIRVK